eukprot:6523648-Prymnesium_polylepis.1
MAKSLDDCIVCAAGTSCQTGSAGETACAAGTYSGLPGKEACTDCAPGTFQDERGATVCRRCLLGHFCPAAAAAPLLCEKGSYSDATDLMSAAQCTTCPPHHRCPAGSTAPEPCEPGSHAPHPGWWECVRCPGGSFQPVAGAG